MVFDERPSNPYIPQSRIEERFIIALMSALMRNLETYTIQDREGNDSEYELIPPRISESNPLLRLDSQGALKVSFEIKKKEFNVATFLSDTHDYPLSLWAETPDEGRDIDIWCKMPASPWCKVDFEWSVRERTSIPFLEFYPSFLTEQKKYEEQAIQGKYATVLKWASKHIDFTPSGNTHKMRERKGSGVDTIEYYGVTSNRKTVYVLGDVYDVPLKKMYDAVNSPYKDDPDFWLSHAEVGNPYVEISLYALED